MNFIKKDIKCIFSVFISLLSGLYIKIRIPLSLLGLLVKIISLLVIENTISCNLVVLEFLKS